MSALKIPARGLDLGLTPYPSFTLSLFEEVDGRYVKLAGRSAGCWIAQRGDTVVSTCPRGEVEEYSGLWFLEVKESCRVCDRLYWLLEALEEAYPGLGLSVDTYDPLHIFTAVFLSQSTSYHVNVLSWARRLWRMSGDPLEAAELAPGIGGSYQLRRLPQAVRCVAGGWPRDSAELRLFLLRCRFVGPKTADATLLFARADTASAPVDRHFAAMNRRLGLFEGVRLPEARLCRRYRCGDCPARGDCLRWLAAECFGRLAGWVQTALYVHDRKYCSRGGCGECPLRRECRGVGGVER
ncbi:N-glycosylase/DNA lyase [Thermofilum pendens]|uniref:DNA lyase n=1 Tax=Thermofilum pendens (strain DSM 2475 / Hrk 5) TaxID=368408 RepID=A1S0J8_THEPD|nr:hypothetical protein [Thermofilum pendens]ABL78978.1 hypothetical protein Tpen_1583 [Thermofilum pendens Hrk 5]